MNPSYTLYDMYISLLSLEAIFLLPLETMPLSARQWHISPSVFLRCLCYLPPFPIVGSHQGNQEHHTGQYALDK